ncbi:MAG: S9 family peptidase, partial [Bacteroidetes bacterium QS_3_64_15]
MQEVRDVVLSPRGRSVAYTVRHVVSDTRSSARSTPVHRTQLYVARTSGRRAPTLLIRKGRDLRQPAWHPDGTFLAYVQSVQGTPQVFVVSPNGGDPYQLTNYPSGAERPQWSPDGERLLFASAVPESALERRSGRP